ncbi:MAG: hypothetical protein PHH00_01675 [Candidatus Nanoarchaeia archaeon]|nr:hypothetical protein [Candidatus Nanoarchaeia archaeon]
MGNDLEQSAREFGVAFCSVNVDGSITYKDKDGSTPIDGKYIQCPKVSTLISAVLPANRDEQIRVRGYAGRENTLVFDISAAPKRGREYQAFFAYVTPKEEREK